jgi:hypothetical protein
MESNDPNKKFEDLFKNFSFSFHSVPLYSFNNIQKQETPEEMIARLDEDDEMIDAMNEYPQAKKMLETLFGEK